MSSKETFKIVLISIIFTISALIALPEIPFVVNSRLWTIDSSIGGYKLKIPQKDGEKIIDFSDFKKESEIGDAQKITYSLKDENIQDKDKALISLQNVIKNRLSLAGVVDFNVGIEDSHVFVVIPEHEDFDRVNQLVSGSGKMIFRTVKNASEWSPDKFTDFFVDVEKWEDTDITERDIQDLLYMLDPTTGSSRMVLSFTPQGREKFYNIAENNIGLPVAIYLNDLEYPLLMPVIVENILDDRDANPSVNTNYSKRYIEDFNLQIKNPLPFDITYVDKVVVTSPAGENFVSKSLISLGIALVMISIFFIIKFNLTGLIFTYTSVCSMSVFLALVKIFSLPMGFSLISGCILVTGIISSIGYLVFENIKSGLKDGKPFDILFYQVFKKEKEKISAPSIFILFVSLLLMLITTGKMKIFMSVTVVGMLTVILFYTLFLPTLLFALGRDEK